MVHNTMPWKWGYVVDDGRYQALITESEDPKVAKDVKNLRKMLLSTEEEFGKTVQRSIIDYIKKYVYDTYVCF